MYGTLPSKTKFVSEVLQNLNKKILLVKRQSNNTSSGTVTEGN